MIGQVISHYKILEKLGEGGMGVVYKAQDLRLDRPVALKFLPASVVASEDDVARFQQEAKAISSLNHPNIATIHDVGEADGHRFLVLEFLPGGTVKSQIKNLQSSGRESSVAQVVEYGLQMAEGLAHAHRHSIVHRDVKTDNMMLTEEGKVKITDFGLARLRGSVHLTKTGTTVGTAAYMSPEQVMGESVDHRSDLFSFGIVLYELATNHLPFRGEHEAALSYSIVNEPPASIKSLRPNIPEALDKIIQRCLEKEKEKRYQDAQEIVTDLRKLSQEISGHVTAQVKRSKLPWITAAAVILLAAVAFFVFFPKKTVSVDRKSIAVLPFKNLSESKENEYFSDGITEDIITQLSNIRELKVISRTSVMRYKNADKSLRDIGKELDVATILEGSVRRANNEVRIVAQLIDANTDEHLWAQTYDKELTKIFAIQSEIAQQIASALKATLSSTEKERIEKKPTENVDAYAFYLRGREYYYRYHKPDNENAIALFKKALELDPNYALAYAGLGDAYGQGTQKFGFTRVWKDSAIAMSKKAISLDPNLSEAYKALGLAYGEKGWFHKALEAARKAVELNPNFAPAVANIGWGYWLLGTYDEGLLWMKKSVPLNPAFAYNSFGVGIVYLSLEDYAKAEQWFIRALELQPDFTYGYAGLSMLYQKEGKHSQAIQQSEKLLSIAPDDVIGLSVAGDAQILLENYSQAKQYYERVNEINPEAKNIFTAKRVTTALGYTYWKTGEKNLAVKMFNRGVELDTKELEEGSEWYLIPFDLAAINAIQGKKIEAYKWLQKAIDAGWRDFRIGMIDPQLENLRNDEQFKQMRDQVKAKVEEMRKKVETQEANRQP